MAPTVLLVESAAVQMGYDAYDYAQARVIVTSALASYYPDAA